MAPTKSVVGIGDADVVRRAQTGDKWALDVLYRRHVKSVGGLTARLLGGDDVEDVVHDTFLIAFRKIGRLRDPGAFRPWLMSIATMQIRQTLRRRARRRAFGFTMVDSEEGLHSLASDDASPELRAELRLLDAVLCRMPTDLRLVWMLMHVEGYRINEIASLCDRSPATVKRRLRAARAHIEAHHEVPR